MKRGKNACFLADLLVELGGTPPPLNGKSFCRKKLSGIGGTSPPPPRKKSAKQYFAASLIRLQKRVLHFVHFALPFRGHGVPQNRCLPKSALTGAFWPKIRLLAQVTKFPFFALCVTTIFGQPLRAGWITYTHSNPHAKMQITGLIHCCCFTSHN